MPVTAKLSQKFYDKLGDDIANELVTWFNMIDATYRTDLRELNDRNFERFEATLARALAEQGATLREVIAEQGVVLRKEMAQQGKEIAQQGKDISREMTVLTRWMVGLWSVQILAFIGMMNAVLQR